MAVKIYDTMTTASDGFPLAYAEKINVKRQDGSEDNLQNLFNNGTLSGGGATYTQLSQAEYDALTDEEKLNGTEYRTYDTGHIYKLGVEYGKDSVQISDNETVEDKTWSSKKTSDEIAKKADKSYVDDNFATMDKIVGGVAKYEINEHSTGAGSTSGIDIVTLPKGHKYIVVAHFQIDKTITDVINMNGSVASNGVGVTVRYMPHNGGGADATLLIDATNENAVIRCYSHNPTSEDLYFQYTVQVMTLA